MRKSLVQAIRVTRGIVTAGLLLCALSPTIVGAAGTPRVSGRAPSTRVDALFVLDNSGSMRAHDKERTTHRLVTGFAAAMPRGGRLGIVLFDASARLIEPLTRTIGPESIAHWTEVMRQVDFGGQRTNSPAGIERALYELKHNGRPDAEKIIVFITDGIVDTGDRQRDIEKSRWLKNDLAAESRRAGVRIYGIAFTEAADVELIQALALETGGEYWRVEHADEIAGVLDGVSRLIREPVAARTDVAESGDDFSAKAPRDRLPPPVSAAPPNRTRGVVLLSLGLGVAALVLLYPIIERRRRRVRPVSPVFGLSAQALPSASLPALPRQGRPPVVKLVDVSGATQRGDAVLLLEKPSTRIGRDPGSEVAIPSDTVSSFHATIDYRDGYFYIEDHRSTNGTRLDGHPLAEAQPVRLKSGDCIHIANFEFRFLIPDHEPRGRTAVLGGTSLPAAMSRGEEEQTDGPDAEPAMNFVTVFDQCLSAHLTKIEELGEDHRRFVDRAFPLEIRALLARRSQDLIERVQAENQAEQIDLSKAKIHYTLTVMPEPMERARTWYTERHGGYAKFLVGLLDAWASSERVCDAICVITFGMVSDAWLSITIVPARDDSGVIEVMSFDFLSEDERRTALSLDIVDAGIGAGDRREPS